jgi:hypothetical protein
MFLWAIAQIARSSAVFSSILEAQELFNSIDPMPPADRAADAAAIIRVADAAGFGETMAHP